MGFVLGLIRLVPGLRHIALGRAAAGVGWFAAFALAVNFGLLTPVAWPGGWTRALRVILLGLALVIAVLSRRSASRLEKRARPPA